jgi:type I restriction enzyme S subunit
MNNHEKWSEDNPEGWRTYKLKFLLSALESGKRESSESAPLDQGALSIGGEHIKWNGKLNLRNPRFISFDYFNSMDKGKIKKGDVLLVKDGATIGKTAIITEEPSIGMAVNEHVFILRPNNRVSSKLLYYLICSSSGFAQIKLTETGSAQGGINMRFADKVLFQIPENSESQDYITHFLDRVTSQIDGTIQKGRKLIEILKEKRNALIDQTVTKGLDPNVPMKNSGISWIGEVPEHWKIVSLRGVLKQRGEYNVGPRTTNILSVVKDYS